MASHTMSTTARETLELNRKPHSDGKSERERETESKREREIFEDGVLGSIFDPCGMFVSCDG